MKPHPETPKWSLAKGCKGISLGFGEMTLWLRAHIAVPMGMNLVLSCSSSSSCRGSSPSGLYGT